MAHLPAELVLLTSVPNNIMLFKKICVTQFVGSQFPDQMLNWGHSSESQEP